MVQNWRASSKARGNVVKNNKVIPWNIGTKRGWTDVRFILPFHGPTLAVRYRKISRLNGPESEIVLHGITVIFFDSISRSWILFFFMDKFPRRVAVFYEIKILSNISITNYSFMQHSIINIFHIIFSFKILTRL